MIIKEQKGLGWREIRRLCNSILNMMDDELANNELFNDECEAEVTYDLKCDSTAIEIGFNRIFAEDFDIDKDFYRERSD